MSHLVVTDARHEDVAIARRLSVETGMFPDEESIEVERQLRAVVEGTSPGMVLAATTDGEVVGAGHVAPEPFSDRCWNLYFLVVAADRHGQGVGTRILAEVERRLRDLGPDRARILLIETSSTAQYDDTRAFYLARGYVQEATVRDYYGPGDHRVIFWKRLHP